MRGPEIVIVTRNFGIARKLLAVCLSFGLPVAVMFVLMTKAKLAEIEFATLELAGDAFQRPLEAMLEHVSAHDRLRARSARGDSDAGRMMREEEAAIERALAGIVAATEEHGEVLQFTAEGLGLRNRNEFTAARLGRKWHALKEAPTNASATEDAYRALIAHVRTMITHAGDISNLILDPDLDSYYLMDVTLLALPQMEERIHSIAVDVENTLSAERLTSAARVRFATLAAFLSEADWDRVAASTRTAFNEDPNFHGTSASLQPRLAPHLDACGAAVARVVGRLRTVSSAEASQPADLVAFHADIEALDRAIYAFHRDALSEEDRLLSLRIGDFTKSLHLGFALAGMSVLLSAFLAFVLASNIVRRVRRISASTDAFAKGDMSARVGDAGSDELGELARSFDVMTGRIGGLSAEVQKRAAELQGINENLERIVTERTGELQHRNDAFRLILDNAHDGMLTVDMSGGISSERSATVDRWFGAPKPESTFGDYIGAGNPTLAAELRLGLEEVAADVLPLELALDQLPRQMVASGRHLRLLYQPILDDGKVSRLLVIISDVTGEIAAQRAAAHQEETLRIFHACQRDRSGFLDFFVEARDIVQKVASGERRPTEIARLVHTLKGNCALFGVLSMSGLCHDVETNMAEGSGGIAPRDVERLRGAWSELSATVAQIMGEDAAGKVEVADEEYAAIVDAIARGAPRRDILTAIARWKLEPTERQLNRFVERARSIARRLGKDVEVTIESNDVRLCTDTWAPVWSVLSHVVRNAIDHGIETRAERVASGKAPIGKLHLRTRHGDGRLWIEVTDDGRGVSWELVAAKARAAHLPFATRRDLIEAIFADGISTKQEVTEMSGRGVGMAAVREVCAALGGVMDVSSEGSSGTTVRCSFPEQMMTGTVATAIFTRPITRSLAPVA